MKTRLRLKRRKRIRGKVRGVASNPRLSVFRSSKYVFAQLIDDETGRVLAMASSREILKKGKTAGNKTSQSHATGALLAERAKAKGVARVTFDRGGYAYKGRVKAVAEGAREGGLQF
ncbi:MAG: 50S ribosomal protein L18 [bacterium]|nr:50S ribosomal protein L18 [bacterium]